MDLEQIKRLVSFDSHGACVLSAFLNLAPQRQVERTYRTIFKDLHEELGERLDEPRRAELNAESTRVAQWLDANPPQGRALAIFSCTPAGLWEAFSLQVPVPDRLAFASRVVATIPAEMFAGTAEILERTLEIERQIERTTEDRLLAELFETAAAGGLGTVGVDRTLEALFLGEVRTLVIADGAPAEGSECPNCGRLTTGRPSACPACGNRMDPVADVFERAIERTLAMSGSVEVVHNEPAQRLLEAGGGMGAFLRYTT